MKGESVIDNTDDNKRKDPREHARAKSDIKRQLQTKVRELRAEQAQLDQRIRDLEVKAARESDGDKVVEILAERKRCEARKEALPFLLRGEQSRALLRQAEALFEEAVDVKVDLDAAEAELETATAGVLELKRQLAEAEALLPELTTRRDALSNNHKSLTQAAGAARADAGCVERGEPCKFEPGRFLGE